MSNFYKGIELEGLDKDVSLVHSIALQSMGRDKNVNVDYLSKLSEIKRADVAPEQFNEINKLWSVVKMNYQICNGGIGQYFVNEYHKHWLSEDKETEIFYKEEQVATLRKMHEFAIEVFPENSAENSKFARIIDFFDALYLEENVPQMEMIYSDEDEQIVDEETGFLVDNPAYEEPYEECVGYEDEIWSTQACYQADSFNKNYYEINDYVEKVMEVYAQFITKSIERENDISELLSHDEAFRYRMLSRMKMDCNYYLGYGNCYPGHLWAKNEYNQILYMKALWNSFPEDGKPEWLSMEQICDYEKKMLSKDDVLYPYLAQSDDFALLKASFSANMLSHIEENIHEYEETDLIESDEATLELTHKEGKDVFQAAIAWYTGSIDTQSFIEDFSDLSDQQIFRPSLADKIQAAETRSVDVDMHNNPSNDIER